MVRRVTSSVLVSAAVFFGFLGSASTTHAEPVCASAMAPHITWAQGLAFIATVDTVESAPNDTFDYNFAIERTIVAWPTLPEYAAGNVVHAYTSGCGPIRLKAGHRYLITTYPGNAGFQALYSVVWELDGERATLVRMYHGRAFDYTDERGGFLTTPDSAIKGVRTIDDAIYLITNGSLPETDASFPAPEPRHDWPGTPAVWLTIGLASFAVLQLRRRIQTAQG